MTVVATVPRGLPLSLRERFTGRVDAVRRFGLADPLAGTPAARDSSVAWMTFMGIPQQTDGVDTYTRLADYADAPADVAWVYACVNRIAAAASKVPLRVWVKRGKSRIPWEDEPTPAAEDLQHLLDTVNPVDMTGAELKAYLRASAKVWGGWYLKRVRGRLLHDTQELYWLRVPDVEPKSANGRSVDVYKYAPQRIGNVGNTATMAMAEDIYPEDMIRHRGLNLGSQIHMISPLSAARYDMVSDSAASLRTASTLRRRGVPEGYWSGTKGTELTPADKSAIRRFLRGLVGPRNAGKSLVAPDIEFHAIELTENDAQWLNGRKVSRMMVSAIIGVPLVLAGDDEKAGVYASIRDAQRVFWQDTMIPDLDGDADALNNWLVPEFNRPGDPVLCVGFDYSGVEPLKPLWKDEWDGWMQGLDHQAVVANEFRRHFGLGDDVPWGDRPLPRTAITLRPADVTTQELSSVIPGLDTANVVTPAQMEVDTSDTATDAGDTIRSMRRLYAHPAVRSFIAGNGLGDLGFALTSAQREVLEDGLRSRQSAAQIADRLAAIRQDGGATDAVVGQLRAQWPDRELDIVRRGVWSYDPSMKLSKIDYARRPVARNPQKVDDFTAALQVGAPMRPAVIVKNDGAWTPIDGWHHLLAADHAGLKKVPVYKGEGDEGWVGKLLEFNNSIPTPATKSASEKEG